MEDLMFVGTGLHKSFENKEEKEYRENDKDVVAKDKAEAENACEYLRTFEALSQANADMKIRICNKLKAHYSNIRDDKSFESLESFCNTQSLEAGAAAEAAGGTNNSKGDKAKIDQSKLGAKKQGFFAKAWEAIKHAFVKIFEWIRDKIEIFVNWVKRIFAKDKNASADTIYNDMSDSEINELESAISKFEFENQSEEGGYIPMTRASGAKFTETTNKYVTICNQFVSLMTECISTGYKPEGMVSYINKLIEVLSKNMHGIGNLPRIENANPEQIKKFNRDVKVAAQHLTWTHDPVGYTKFFCGTNFIEAKGKKITCEELYGTDNPREILRIAEDVGKEFEAAKRNVETAFKAVNKKADEFSDFLKKLNLSSGSITSGSFQMNEQGNNVSDESKADAEKNYEFIATCQAFYNIIAKIQNIIGSVAAKALSTTTKATKVIEVKNKIKKGIGDFGKDMKSKLKSMPGNIKTKYRDTINALKNKKEIDEVQAKLLAKEVREYASAMAKAQNKGIDTDVLATAVKDVAGMSLDEFNKRMGKYKL